MREVDRIFEAVGKASRLVYIGHKRDLKKKQIRDVKAKRCGNCYHWMKSSCKPEKELGQFQSMNSFGCNDFENSQGFLIEKFIKELKEIELELEEECK